MIGWKIESFSKLNSLWKSMISEIKSSKSTNGGFDKIHILTLRAGAIIRNSIAS